MILISACLVGLCCRYDGKRKFDAECVRLMEHNKAIPFCPEQLGGLSTPRMPCEIVGGDGLDVLNGDAKVINDIGEDCSAQFIRGAEEALFLSEMVSAKRAILKGKSPSCGVGQIYDGTFSSVLRRGDGVCAALLKKHGIQVDVK